MTKILLYKKDGCHLCDEAEAILEKHMKEKGFLLEKVMLQKDTDMFERFGNRVPIVFINDKLTFEFKLDEQDFLGELAKFD